MYLVVGPTRVRHHQFILSNVIVFTFRFILSSCIDKKANFTVEQTMKAQRGSRAIALLFL